MHQLWEIVVYQDKNNLQYVRLQFDPQYHSPSFVHLAHNPICVLKDHAKAQKHSYALITLTEVHCVIVNIARLPVETPLDRS